MLARCGNTAKLLEMFSVPSVLPRK